MGEKEVLEELKRCIEENDLLTSAVIRCFLTNEMHKYKLGPAISEIKLNNARTDDNLLGSYNFSDMKLRINYLYYIRETLMEDIDNICLIDICFHELTHASQRLMLQNTSILNNMPTFYINLVETIVRMKKNYIEYIEHHDDYIFEYQAKLMAQFRTIDVLNKMNLDTTSYNKTFANNIIDYYQNGCPLKKSREIVKTEDQFLTPDVDEYYKLIFGYDLSDKTIYNLENIASGKVKVLDITRYIQK